ncbi:MAG: DUF447 family protein [Candidatus Lokiarchaeota archaeon]|nr:DUF447 family protein [Candidatus Lokiarchaeota archaeon]
MDEIDFPFENGKLYESIVVIQWPNQQRFNASAMGIRFSGNKVMFLKPYPDTDTFELLMNPNVKFITINFTDDVEYFALAALRGEHAGIDVEEMDQSYLDIHKGYAFLKQSQILILGEINIRNKPIFLKNPHSSEEHPEFKVTFQVLVKEMYQSFKQSQPVNRGDNLALEAIVYASKIPAIQKQQNSRNDIQKLIDRVRDFQYDIRRFSASQRALKVCDMVDKFLEEIKS